MSSLPKERIRDVGKTLAIFADCHHLDKSISKETKVSGEEASRFIMTEPQYDFPKTLKFSQKINLAESYKPYKNLVAGFDGNCMMDLTELMPQYNPVMHHNIHHHPLKHFQYHEFVQQLIRQE